METNQKLQRGKYEYQIISYRKKDGMHQGMILVTAHAGIKQTPIVEIPTPASFKTEHSAKIEASALACHLIETGAMNVLIPQNGQHQSWPVEFENAG